MKVFIILAVYFTSTFAATITKEQFNKFSTECIHELNLDQASNNSKDNKTNAPTKKDENCYMACLDKKQGIMKSDGSYDINMILSYVELPEMQKKVKSYVDELMNTCKPEVGNDICKLAACFHRMPKVYWGKE